MLVVEGSDEKELVTIVEYILSFDVDINRGIESTDFVDMLRILAVLNGDFFSSSEEEALRELSIRGLFIVVMFDMCLHFDALLMFASIRCVRGGEMCQRL